MKKSNVLDFEQAEKNAKKRDFDLEKLKYALDHAGVPQENVENALLLLSKATGKDIFIGTKRSRQSKVRFAGGFCRFYSISA